MMCACHKKVSLRQGLGDLIDEAGEIVKTRNKADFMDELSDISYAVGRLLGAAVGREYIRMPFDDRHVTKVAKRMARYGCIRSERWLKDGVCPNTAIPDVTES
jgi:hypothetical protein